MGILGSAALSIGSSLLNQGNGTGSASGAQLPSMTDMQTLPDVARSWMWTANITGVSGLPAFNNLVLADMTVPFEGFTADPKFKGGFIYNYPKFISVTPSTMTFHELETYVVSGYLSAWKAKMFDETLGNFGIPADYYGQIIATLFDGTGNPAMEVTLRGCWPERQADLNLTTAGSNALQVSCNFSINRSNITFIAANLLNTPLGALLSSNPLASLKSLAGVGLASLTSTAESQVGSLLSGGLNSLTSGL